MGWRFLLLGLVVAWGAQPVFAQPVEEPPTISFSPPVLEPPSREDSGPIGRKVPERRKAEPISIPTVSLDPVEAPAAAVPPAVPVAPVAGPVAIEPPAEVASDQRLRGYVDGLMAGLVASGEIPGATIVVIQNGTVALKAGYGFADIRARTPVDPDRTRFRVASISKLFTTIAVMQLVDQGKIDLSADVNTYLGGFKVPPTFPEPVTLANILTHTAGFDDRYLGIGAPLSELVEPLGQYLARTMPPRVLPPGKTFAYSNHAFGLAGHIVESVSGQEFGAYVQANILAPLGMSNSMFGVPYPVPQDIAVPYFKGGNEGGFARSELDRVRLGPAGDLLTTAGDMAPFMLAQLNRGAIDGPIEGAQLLSPASTDVMHARHFVQVEGLDGWAYGFMEGHRNGIRWIGHDGSWLGFCSQLVLNPETKSGFFVAYNGNCHFAASAPLRKALFDLLWPAKAAIVAETNQTSELRARAVVGSYMAVRRARSDFTVIGAGASQLAVTAPGDGVLTVTWPGAGRSLSFLPQANGNWINPDYQLKAGVLVDARGQATQLALDTNVFDRVVGASQWAMWSVALGVVVGLCVMTIWGWTNGFLSRQMFGEPHAVITFMPRLIGFLAAGLTIACLVTMAALLQDEAALAIIHGPTPMLMVLLSVPVAIAVLAIPMIVWSMVGFGSGGRARLAQAGYAVLTIGILVFVAFAWQWGLHPFAMSH
ncbi:MAG: beta-lactamase family protein [Alphaproteobacteria bacterium]|nr:beta-lactamase family protein [Alphaproteobacteria bacterium]